ncbi:MAG: hypothetical protein ACTSXJ_11490 [Candidatus Baldrarchaeia archaeon]|mgnify:CR=1 FL=1
MASTEELKSAFLELLEKDKEFRYAVAARIGLLEILKRLDGIEEEQKKVWEEIRGLREEQTRTWEEIRKVWQEIEKLREGQNKIWEEIRRIWEEIQKLREEQTKIWQEIRKIWQEIEKLRREVTKIWEEIERLREGQNRIWEEIRKIWEEIRRLREEQTKIWQEIRSMRESFERRFERIEMRLNRVERTLEKLTLEIEEEAREVVEYRLRKMGIRVELKPLSLPDMEINLYGATEKICVIGEAKVRAGASAVQELLGKFERMKKMYPGFLREKVMLVLYVTTATPDVVEEGKKRKVWILKATEDLTPPPAI